MMRLCDDSLWESLARSDDSATFFQTPAWHRLASEFEGTETVCMLFKLEGHSVLLPLQKKSRLWGSLYSAPFGTYTSFLWDKEPPLRVKELLKRELGRFNLNLPGSPFAPRWPVGIHGELSQTKVLKLAGLKPDEWISTWSRNHRRLLRQARDWGYSIRVAQTSADVSEYYSLYRDMTRRWGSKARRVYSEELFQEIFRRFFKSTSMNLLLAESGGNIVAGRLCFYHNRHAVEWHAAAKGEDMERGVNHLLVHAAVIEAEKRGCGVYDFNPNPGLPTVDHFKRGFAPETLEFSGWSQRSGVSKILNSIRDGLKKS